MRVLDEEKKDGQSDYRFFQGRIVLIRPAAANVDQALVIFALSVSRIRTYQLLDRFLTYNGTAGDSEYYLFQ